MIRRGNAVTGAASVANVLTGTQFETITRRSRIVVRCRGIGTTGEFPAASRFKLELESTTLSDGYLQNQRATDTAGNDPVGLDDMAIVYSGWIDPGNLSLTFTGATGGSIAWDATLLAVQ